VVIKLYILQVNLAQVFTLNGIVVTDWYKTSEVLVNNTLSMTIDRKGTYSFELEVGTALSSMIMHGTKVSDTSMIYFFL
jgi:hypothetical protein